MMLGKRGVAGRRWHRLTSSDTLLCCPSVRASTTIDTDAPDGATFPVLLCHNCKTAARAPARRAEEQSERRGARRARIEAVERRRDDARVALEEYMALYGNAEAVAGMLGISVGALRHRADKLGVSTRRRTAR